MQVETQTLAHKSVVGVFDSQTQADAVLDQFRAVGLGLDNVSVMMRDAQQIDEVEVVKPLSPIAGGAATGATLGAAVGVVLGWMLAIGSIQIPGIVVGTPSIPGVGTPLGDAVMVTTIIGLLLGAAVGGLIGALVGLTIPVDRSAVEEARPHEGRILVTVHPTAALDVENVARLMQSGGGYDVRVYDAPVMPVTTSEQILVAEGITDGGDTNAAPEMAAAVQPVESFFTDNMSSSTTPAAMPPSPDMADTVAMDALATMPEMPAMSEPPAAPEPPMQPMTAEAMMTQVEGTPQEGIMETIPGPTVAGDLPSNEPAQEVEGSQDAGTKPEGG